MTSPNELTPVQIWTLRDTLHATTWPDGSADGLPAWVACGRLATDLAPVVAEMLDEARAEERERIAAEIMDRCPCSSCRAAARIAWGEA